MSKTAARTALGAVEAGLQIGRDVAFGRDVGCQTLHQVRAGRAFLGAVPDVEEARRAFG